MKKFKIALIIALATSFPLFLQTIIAACVSAPVYINFEECSPVIDTYTDTVPYTDPLIQSTLYYQVVGPSNAGCIMLYSSNTESGRSIEEVNYDSLCIVPQELGEVEIYSTDLSDMEDYCFAIPD